VSRTIAARSAWEVLPPREDALQQLRDARHGVGDVESLRADLAARERT